MEEKLKRLRRRLRLPEHARERGQAFSRFVWHRFVEDRCFETAAVLAYTTVFALVPLSVLVFGIVAAFPAFERWNETLSSFLFTHFVPGAARTVEAYLRESASSAGKMTSAGLLGVLIAALFLMKSVEDSLNRIWRVSRPRSRAARFLVYWTALTLGPLALAVSLTLSSWALALPWVSASGIESQIAQWLQLLPFVVELVGFSLLYALVPNQSVSMRHALVGGLLATLLFELAKSGFAAYLRQVPSYEQIYGTLAVLPIFLLWIYLSWAVLLLGGSIAASLSSFRFQPASQRLPQAMRWLASLRMIGRLLDARQSGQRLSLDTLRALEPAIDDDMLVGLLDTLGRSGLIERSAEGDWLLACDPQQVRLADLHAVIEAHLPLKVAAEQAGLIDPLGQRVMALHRPLVSALLPALDRPLAMLGTSIPKD